MVAPARLSLAALATLVLLAPSAGEAQKGKVGPCDMAEGRLAPTTANFFMDPAPDLSGFVIWVEFPDAPGFDANTSDQLAALAKTTNEYFRGVSRGRHGLKLRGTSTFLEMPKPSSAYGITKTSFPHEGANELFADAVAAADVSHNLNGVDTVLIMLSLRGYPGALAYAEVPADGDVLRRAYVHSYLDFPGAPVDSFSPALLMHELGHHFGLPDLYVVGRKAPDDQRTMGPFDIMAGGARDYLDRRAEQLPRFSSYSLHMMGELRAKERVCISEGRRRVLLTPLYRGGGKKMVFLKTSPTTGYTVEVRHRSERYLCGARGVVIAKLDSNAPYDRDPQAMNLVNAEEGDRGKCIEGKAPFTEPGVLHRDRKRGVKIKLIERRGEDYLVSVKVGGG